MSSVVVIIIFFFSVTLPLLLCYLSLTLTHTLPLLLLCYLSLSLTLTLLLTLLKIPIIFLHGLHTYIHPSAPHAALRRPESSPVSPSTAFTFSFVAASSLLLLLYSPTSSSSAAALMTGSTFIPVLLAFTAIMKLLVELAKVSEEKSASRRSEKQLSLAFGAAGLAVGSVACFRLSPDVLDFDFNGVDGNGKVLVAVLMGCLSGFLFMPAAKSARAF